MELRQLRYFVEVASSGSINSAAERLQLSQSAVSRQIRDLEAELGVMLFRRRSEGIALTHSGSLFITGANAILGQVDALASAVQATSELATAVRLGMPPSVSPMLLDALESTLADGPVRLHVTLVEGSSFWLQQRLDGGDLACAVLTNGRESRTVRTVPLWREALVLLGPVDSPLSGRDRCALEEIAAIPLTLTPPSDGTRIAIDAAFAQVGLRPTVRQEHEAMNLLTAQLESGHAYTILTRTVAQHLQSRFRLSAVPIADLSIERVFSVRRGALSQKASDKIATTLIGIAASKFGEDPWITLARDARSA